MSKGIWIGVGVALVAAAGAVVYWQTHHNPPAAAVATAPAPAPATPVETVAPPPAEVIPSPPPDAQTAPLPALDASDATIRQRLLTLFTAPIIADHLVSERLIRRIVATIDSLDGDAVPLRLRPLGHLESLPIVSTDADGGITLDPQSFGRYAPYIAALNAADAGAIADFYLRYQRLFQQAHEQLGYPGQSFNARLLKVIDHLLATPEVQPPIRLLRPQVLYEFQDRTLELRSSGQKLLIRMGPDNAAAVKAKLRQIRAALTTPR